MSGWEKPVFESSTPLGLNAERSRSVEIRIPYKNTKLWVGCAEAYIR
ncbi:hypothetical protein CKA32_001206 [Geitlerinema sp. FC II]|nr:hypothetical protein CKA32_001206 [Geitlerinema sp. FC II]